MIELSAIIAASAALIALFWVCCANSYREGRRMERLQIQRDFIERPNAMYEWVAGREGHPFKRDNV